MLIDDNPADARLARESLAGGTTPFQVAQVARLSDVLEVAGDAARSSAVAWHPKVEPSQSFLQESSACSIAIL